MTELYHEAIAWYNLPLTFMLVIVVVYWGMVCLGAMDLEAFDIDFDLDGDADLEADIGGGGGALMGLLKFVNVGTVPLMVVVSVLVVAAWFVAIIANYYLNPFANLLIGLGVVLGAIFIGIFLTKVITLPLRALFKEMNKTYEEHEPVVGRICKVKTGEVSEKFGQAEVETKGANLLLNVRLAKGSDSLKRNDQALIVSYEKEQGIYHIKKITNEDI